MSRQRPCAALKPEPKATNPRNETPLGQNVDWVAFQLIDHPGHAPILLNRRAAARYLGISATHLDSLVKSGRLGPVPHPLGKRKLYSLFELTEWVKRGLPPRHEWIEYVQGNARQ